MTLIETIRTTLTNRARYARTARELRILPLATQIDLDLNARDTDAIAYQAVYNA